MLILIVAVIIIFVIITSFFYKIYTEAEKIHSTLDAFKTMATVTNNKKELRDIEIRLRLYVKKECWHTHHMSHAREVLSYIQGKLNVIHL